MARDRRYEASHPTKRVLAVDEGPFGQKLVHDILECDGYAVTCARDGEAAIRMLAEQDFDLVVTDLGTTRMEGAETVRRIREMPGPKNRVPVVILSGLTRLESPTLAMHKADELLLLPVSLAALRDVVLRWTSGDAARGRAFSAA